MLVIIYWIYFISFVLMNPDNYAFFVSIAAHIFQAHS